MRIIEHAEKDLKALRNFTENVAHDIVKDAKELKKEIKDAPKVETKLSVPKENK